MAYYESTQQGNETALIHSEVKYDRIATGVQLQCESLLPVWSELAVPPWGCSRADVELMLKRKPAGQPGPSCPQFKQLATGIQSSAQSPCTGNMSNRWATGDKGPPEDLLGDLVVRINAEPLVSPAKAKRWENAYSNMDINKLEGMLSNHIFTTIKDSAQRKPFIEAELGRQQLGDATHLRRHLGPDPVAGQEQQVGHD